MTLELKDIVYFIVYIVSMVGAFFTYKNRIVNIERDVERNDVTVKGISTKLESMNENIIRIMVHLKIDGR